MQVTETLSEGLKRELKVVVPAKELSSSLDKKLDDIKDQVQIKGFRPGKVPVEHLKRVYGRSIMSEIVQDTVTETSKKAIEDRNEKPAFQPQVALTEDEQEIEQVMEGKSDLAYSLTFEIVPEIELADFSKISVTKEVTEIPETEVDEAVERIAAQNRPFAARADDAKAEDGDRVTIDFTGKIGGEPFEGGSAQDAPLVLGSGQFIPGFEEQLVGVSKGDQTTVQIKFPDDYQAAHLAGKDATFDVTVKEVAAPGEVKIDDEFAKQLGIESLAKLKDAVREQMSGELNQASREKLKRAVLDELEKAHSFDLPPTLVEQEFEQIFGQLKQDMEQSGDTFEKEGTTEEDAAKNYREIAARRVRLGLVLAEAAEKNKIEVTEEEVNNALRQQIQRYPGQEQQVLEYFKQNPQAVAQLRAPIFEEKVIDFILDKATVTEKTVSREHLLHHDHDHDHDHGEDEKKPAKKAAKKKAPAKKSG